MLLDDSASAHGAVYQIVDIVYTDDTNQEAIDILANVHAHSTTTWHF